MSAWLESSRRVHVLLGTMLWTYFCLHLGLRDVFSFLAPGEPSRLGRMEDDVGDIGIGRRKVAVRDTDDFKASEAGGRGEDVEVSATHFDVGAGGLEDHDGAEFVGLEFWQDGICDVLSPPVLRDKADDIGSARRAERLRDHAS